jgi:hypothetical protein
VSSVHDGQSTDPSSHPSWSSLSPFSLSPAPIMSSTTVLQFYKSQAKNTDITLDTRSEGRVDSDQTGQDRRRPKQSARKGVELVSEAEMNPQLRPQRTRGRNLACCTPRPSHILRFRVRRCFACQKTTIKGKTDNSAYARGGKKGRTKNQGSRTKRRESRIKGQGSRTKNQGPAGERRPGLAPARVYHT